MFARIVALCAKTIRKDVVSSCLALLPNNEQMTALAAAFHRSQALLEQSGFYRDTVRTDAQAEHVRPIGDTSVSTLPMIEPSSQDGTDMKRLLHIKRLPELRRRAVFASWHHDFLQRFVD